MHRIVSEFQILNDEKYPRNRSTNNSIRNPIINNHFDLVVLHVVWFLFSVNCCLLVNFPCNSVVTFVCAIWNTFWFPCSCVSLHCSYDICMTIGHATRAHFERINHTVDYVKSHLIAVKMERTKIIISHKPSEKKIADLKVSYGLPC